MIVVSIDDRDIRKALSQLMSAMGDMTPVMKRIGTYLQNATKMRFRDQKAPDGSTWPPSNRVKKMSKGKTLVDTGRLRDSITYISGKDFVEIGTNVVYAATMQFGARKGEFGDGVAQVKQHSRKVGKLATNVRAHERYIRNIPWGDIPPRPFLGISADDKGEIMDIINDYLTNAISG